jgi:hypothetical protein
LRAWSTFVVTDEILHPEFLFDRSVERTDDQAARFSGARICTIQQGRHPERETARQCDQMEAVRIVGENKADKRAAG